MFLHEKLVMASSIVDQQNGILFCNIPFSSASSPLSNKNTNASLFNLARIFAILNAKKNQKFIENYSLSQTTLEQIFIRLAGSDEDNTSNALSDTELSTQAEIIEPRKLHNNK